ncbi:unnamed protein product [Dibothriocephalus latus]|uniref:Agouti domain-containing protein n=1 Tax=Dibothriocephalus latus TaxID=60516 RepID=A0A3P7NI73_DIBLA|nr:unnamed protein product [Dibothriocephalus latus]
MLAYLLFFALIGLVWAEAEEPLALNATSSVLEPACYCPRPAPCQCQLCKKCYCACPIPISLVQAAQCQAP